MSKQVIILDNSLFDDGSIECKTFCVATHDDAFVCEFSTIQRDYAEYVPAILEAIKAGKHYIGIGSLERVAPIVGETYAHRYFEIQWD